MKQHEILKRFISVLVKGKNHSLIVVSPAGYGKTETALITLTELNLKEGQHFKYIPNFITPKALVNELEKTNKLAEPKLLVLDDMEDTLGDPQSIGILKGALWALPDGRRKVSWITSRGSKEFNFEGKVLFLLNKMKKNDVLNALKDRSMFYEISLTNEELLGLMNERSKLPYENISPRQRRKIVQFISKVGNGSKKLSLRLLPVAYQLYQVSPNHWQTLILKRL